MEITMKGISKAFGSNEVLKGVNLTLKSGEIHALMGENGAGKSTLMKILIGAHRADSGTIRFNGEDLEPSTLTVHQALGKGISMIFQELCLVPDMSVAENIFIGREPKIGKTGIVDRKKLIRQTQELLDSFEITFLRPTDSLRGMSTAKMQMIEICKALSYHSKLIIMDEPTAMLDPNGRKEVLNTVHRLNRQKGVTVILITHYMEEVIDADYVFVMDDGHVVMQGMPRDIFSQVDTLLEYGLNVPQITRLAWELKQEGLPLPDGILSRQELVEAICQLKSKT